MTNLDQDSTPLSVNGLNFHSKRYLKNSIDEANFKGYNQMKNAWNASNRILMSRRQRARPNISMLKNENQQIFHWSCSETQSTPNTMKSNGMHYFKN